MVNDPSNPNPQPALPTVEESKTNSGWEKIKSFALAGISAATGDPEAMKTLVEVLANATHNGLEGLPLKDAKRDAIRKKMEESIDQGADKLIETLTWYQKEAVKGNQMLRKSYGRQYKKAQ